MILEVLPAKKGDCLLLHSKTHNGPGLIVIDGGPAGVSRESLLPRLEKIREERIRKNVIGKDDPLDIDLVMVSHVDDDHINGVIDLFRRMKRLKEAKKRPIFRVRDLWHNSFDRILGNDETGQLLASVSFGAASTAAFVQDVEEGPPTDHAKILAGVAQGDELRGLAEALGVPINGAFGGKLIRTVTGKQVKREIAGIEFVVVGPRQSELTKLQRAYDKWLKTQAGAKPGAASLLAALDDKSVANLSSIVLLARQDGKTILLTGDARSDMILKGLEEIKMLEADQSMNVDVLKMPHHGSIRNLDDEGDFVRRITAPHYVLSGNGEHGNPDRATIDLLIAKRKGAAMTFHLTYDLASIDPRRKAEHEKEQAKRRRNGKPAGPDWDDGEDALQTVLARPPRGVTVETAHPRVIAL